MKTLRKAFRFSLEDQALLEKAVQHFGVKTETHAIREALRASVVAEDQSKTVHTKKEICPYEDWTFFPSQGWDTDTGTEYIAIRRPVKPFDTKIVKAGEPWYFNLLEKFGKK